MNEDMKQIQEETFNRIILGIAVVGLVVGVIVLTVEGISSPWFIRAIALLFIAGGAFLVRTFSRLVVASYMLVLQLVGLVMESLLHVNAVTSFTPYLLAPIIVISGLLLNPIATFAITICSMVGILLIIAATGRLSLINLTLLFPPFSLNLVMAFLVIQNKKNITLLGQRLTEDRTLLKSKTAEIKETSNQTEKLEGEITQLKTELEWVKHNIKQTTSVANQKHDALYNLVRQSVSELDSSVKKIEYTVEQLGTLPGSNTYNNLIESAWEEFYRLKALMINLEEITQLEYEKIELNYQEIDIERFLIEAVNATKGLARGKPIEVRYQISEGLPILQADPLRLRQALQHIFNNAIKYTDRGIIEVQAEITDAGELLIFISDTGIGMHREALGIVFEKFGRSNGTLAKQRQGAGLGLAICYQLIHLHGGRMWVTSVLGVGSTFYMALPLKPAISQSSTSKTIASSRVRMPTPAGLPTVVPMPSLSTTISEHVPDPEITSVLENNDDKPTVVISKSPVTQLNNILPATPAQSIPVPPQNDTMEEDKNGITLVMVGSPSSSPEDDEDTTLVLPSKKKISPTGRQVQPIRRFGNMYTRRFVFILIGLLFPVVLLVIALALINGPVEQQTVTTTDTPPTQEVANVSTAVEPTSALVFQPSPTLTTLLSTQETAPTYTPLPLEATVTAVPISTNTPSPTQTSIQNLLTPQPTATPEPDNSQAIVIPAAISQSFGFDPSQLTFFTDKRGGLLPNTTEAIGTNSNSRLNWSPAGQALFAGEQNGNRDIFVTGNEEPVRLTTSNGDDWQPDWSPDGQRVAFSSNRAGNFSIYVMDADGSNLTQLTESRGFDEWPVWSPDGSKLAFVSDRDGNVEIYTINADGTNLHRITYNSADDWPATWSPDGNRLVLASDRDGDWNLYLTTVTGENVVRLTDDPGDERDPIWLPNSQTIAFAYNNGNNWDIYTLEISQSGLSEIPASNWIQITNTPIDERYPTALQF